MLKKKKKNRQNQETWDFILILKFTAYMKISSPELSFVKCGYWTKQELRFLTAVNLKFFIACLLQNEACLQ